MDTEKIDIEVITTVANKCMLHIQETTDYLKHIYHAVNYANVDIHKPFPIDNFPINIDNQVPKPTLEDQKILTINWALIKAFEELINGLTKSLKDTYRYLKVHAIHQEPYTKSRAQIESELQKISVKLEDAHFPEFIEAIEKSLNCKLPLRDEIISINQLRNCLVHRHGIVSAKDIKNSTTGDLRLKWISLGSFTQIDGQEIEITYNYRKDGITVPNVLHKQFSNEKIFKVGDKVAIDLSEFNGFSYTCIEFALQLFKMMPQPNTNLS